mmetsp:Transcript_12790/g.22046  ORF Transcript_12790/g.22046 Transcript_12790/m.22046 type:complete len:100 (+) Transcript_12790:836-1135(+)
MKTLAKFQHGPAEIRSPRSHSNAWRAGALQPFAVLKLDVARRAGVADAFAARAAMMPSVRHTELCMAKLARWSVFPVTHVRTFSTKGAAEKGRRAMYKE